MQECGVVQWQVHEPFLSTFRSAVTVENMRRAVREYICNTTYPMPSGPLGTGPSTPPSQSTSTNNACGRHDCIPPILTPRSTTAHAAVQIDAHSVGNRPLASCTTDSTPRTARDRCHRRPPRRLGRRALLSLCPSATEQWRASSLL